MIKGEKKGKEDRYRQHHHSFLHSVSVSFAIFCFFFPARTLKQDSTLRQNRSSDDHWRDCYLINFFLSFFYLIIFFSARTLKQDSTLRQNRSSDDHWRDYYRRHRLARRPGRDCRRWHGCLYCFLCTDTVLFVKILFSMCHTHAKNAVLYV